MQSTPAFTADTNRRVAADQRSTACSQDYTVASPGAAEASPYFHAGKDSLMNQLPPDPPSPYRPQAQKRTESILPFYFQSKKEAARLRDKKLVQLREAAAMAEAEFQKSQLPTKPSVGRDQTTPEPPGEGSGADGLADENALKEYYFLEAQRQQVSWEESALRIELTSEEELAYTRVLLGQLEDLARAITASELTEEEMATRDEVLSEEDAELRAAKDTRAKERRVLLDSIASATRIRLADERLSKRLQKAFAELLPAHEEGRAAIVAEEQTSLLEVFEWERNHRPLGPGCFISAPVEDPRLRYHKEVKRSRFHRSTTTERAMEELRKGKRGSSGGAADGAFGCGALVLWSSVGEGEDAGETYVDPPNTTPEVVFVDEGKALLAREKSARHLALRRAMALQEMYEEEESQRADIHLEESEAYMPVLLFGVDGVYEARRAARARELREAEEERVALAERIARLDAKCHLLAEDYAADTDAPSRLQNCLYEEGGDPRATAAAVPVRHGGTEAADVTAQALLAYGSGGNPWPAAPGGDVDSMSVNRGDLPSLATDLNPTSCVVLPASTSGSALAHLLAIAARGPTEDNATGEGAARASAVTAREEARSAAIKYLREEHWAHDLVMPEATASLLATQHNLTPASVELLTELASHRAGLVNAQIDSLLAIFPI